MLHVRDGDLRGGVVIQDERPALQHLEAKALALVSVDAHGHDPERQLSGVLHLEALLDGERRLGAAQPCEEEQEEGRGFLFK